MSVKQATVIGSGKLWFVAVPIYRDGHGKLRVGADDAVAHETAELAYCASGGFISGHAEAVACYSVVIGHSVGLQWVRVNREEKLEENAEVMSALNDPWLFYGITIAIESRWAYIDDMRSRADVN